MTRPGWRGYRTLLRNTVISSAAPYGYTLTHCWSVIIGRETQARHSDAWKAARRQQDLHPGAP